MPDLVPRFKVFPEANKSCIGIGWDAELILAPAVARPEIASARAAFGCAASTIVLHGWFLQRSF